MERLQAGTLSQPPRKLPQALTQGKIRSTRPHTTLSGYHKGRVRLGATLYRLLDGLQQHRQVRMPLDPCGRNCVGRYNTFLILAEILLLSMPSSDYH